MTALSATSTSSSSHTRKVEGSVLHLRHISKRFGGVQALDDVCFDLLPGEVHCLAGENGCGKSTLIKVITGVHAPESGARMSYFGEEVTSITPVQARARGIAVIWQDLALFPEMTVAENIGFDALIGQGLRLVDLSSLKAVARKSLDSLGISLDLDAPVRTLPIAKRQMVAIARALAGDARILFMDEPTASLTQTETDALLALVTSLSKRGVAIVFVSHRLAEVLEISSRVTVIRDGKHVGVFSTDGMTQAKLTELMTGQTFDQAVVTRERSTADKVIDIHGLTRHGEFTAIDLSIRQGEVVGITGLIGAGRTELAHAMFGMARIDAGTMTLMGKPFAPRSNRQAMQAGVAYVSEDRLSLGLIQQQSIASNIVLPVLSSLSGQGGLLSGRRMRDTVKRWIDTLAIRIGEPNDAVSTLSGGNQQRVVLSKWLTTSPKLLILDSPTVGVDVGARAGVFEVVQGLAQKGLAILLISDEVPEVYFNADRVLHMVDGQIKAEYQPGDITLDELEARIYA